MTRKRKILNISLDGALLMARHARLQEQGYEVSSASTWTDFEQACGFGAPDLIILGHSLPPSMKNDMWQYTMKHCSSTKVIELYVHAPSLPLPPGHSFNAKASADELLSLVDRVLKPGD